MWQESIYPALRNLCCMEEGSFFGYPTDINPEDMDSVCAEFGISGGSPFVSIYQVQPGTEPAHIKTFSGSEMFSSAGIIPAYANNAGNKNYIERELLRAQFCKRFGLEYNPEEQYESFLERLKPHLIEWRRPPC